MIKSLYIYNHSKPLILRIELSLIFNIKTWTKSVIFFSFLTNELFSLNTTLLRVKQGWLVCLK